MDKVSISQNKKQSKQNKFLKAALYYASLGWPVFPLAPKSKHPLKGTRGFYDATTDPEQIQKWWRKVPNANIGIATGGTVVVLDIDPRHGGDDLLEAFLTVYGPLPHTPTVLTGGGGKHYYFKSEEEIPTVNLTPTEELPPEFAEKLKSHEHKAAITLKGKGGYVVAPPSVHPDTGQEYVWEVSSTPQDVPLAPLPPWLLEEARRCQRVPYELPPNLVEGMRNNSLISLLGTLRRRGLEPEGLLIVAQVVNELMTTPPLELKEVAHVSKSAAKYPADLFIGAVTEGRDKALLAIGQALARRVPQRPDVVTTTLVALNELLLTPPLDPHLVFTIAQKAIQNVRPQVVTISEADKSEVEAPKKDYAHAVVLAQEFKNRFRWAVLRKKWMRYQNGKWSEVPEEVVAQEAVETLLRVYKAQLNEARNGDAIKELASKIIEVCTHPRLVGALTFLKGRPEIVTYPHEWDADPWLLNCRNGVLDLRTFELRPHDPGYLLSKQVNANYNPEARSERWERHLEFFLPDPNLRREVQRELGLALVGAHLTEILPIWWGQGGNGRSTTLKTIRLILGDYAGMAAPRLLLATRYERHPTELADLAGKRLIISIETGQDSMLDEEKVKHLTGGEPVKARYMRGDFFEFPSTWTIILVTNHKPIIRGTDYAIWRRIRLVPWTVTIPEDQRREQDEVVMELMEDADAILAWMVEGLKDWRQNPHWRAQEVQTATENYREEMDIIGRFLAEQCIIAPNVQCQSRTLYQAYVEWCEANGEHALSEKHFALHLQERGFRKVHTKNGKVWLGVGLLETHEVGFDELLQGDGW
jgi:putative DNA primase/helicase